MNNFTCRCGARLFFDNTQCLSCGRTLGFDPVQQDLLSFREGEVGRRFRSCANASSLTCNWLVKADATTPVCRACELNSLPSTVDGESETELEQRRDVERAKRRLIYGLLALGLPVTAKTRNPKLGLAFALRRGSNVLTGHDDGLITLNLAEADPSEREKVRAAMKEKYRTLLGHFRHEVGHYYWYLLVQERAPLAAFRERFGDERQDYAAALKAHYDSPAPWQDDRFISHYAASHPWEDFAETFAHYLHIVDTLQTALEQGFSRVQSVGPVAKDRFERILARWYELSVSLNSLNRSMGVNDAYPFAISPVVASKLRYVHDLVHSARKALAPRWYAPWKRRSLPPQPRP